MNPLKVKVKRLKSQVGIPKENQQVLREYEGTLVNTISATSGDAEAFSSNVIYIIIDNNNILREEDSRFNLIEVLK